MILEARPGRGETREYEAAVVADAGRACQPERLLVEALAASLRHRHRQQPSICIVGPAVIAAHQPRRMSLTLIHYFCATVAAAIEQHLHAAVAVTAHDDRLTAELGRDVVAWLRHLAGVADEQPSRSEDALQLELEQLRIGIHAPMDAARFNQLSDFLRVSVAHEFISPMRAGKQLYFTALWA